MNPNCNSVDAKTLARRPSKAVEHNQFSSDSGNNVRMEVDNSVNANSSSVNALDRRENRNKILDDKSKKNTTISLKSKTGNKSKITYDVFKICDKKEEMKENITPSFKVPTYEYCNTDNYDEINFDFEEKIDNAIKNLEYPTLHEFQRKTI